MASKTDKMKPKEYLEYLQTEYGALTTFEVEQIEKKRKDLGSLWKHDSQLESFMKRKLEDLKKVEPSTEREPKVYSLQLSVLRKQLELSVAEHGYELPEVVIGTFPLGDVNAMTFEAPGGGYIITVNHGLFGFLYLLAKIISEIYVKARQSTESDFKEIRRIALGLLSSDSSYVDSFADVLEAYLIDGNPWNAKYVPALNLASMTLADYLCFSAELFVVGHEYGHILSKSYSDESEQAPLGREDMQNNSAWIEELKADHAGARLQALALARMELDLALASWGIQFLFSCAEVIYKALSRNSDKGTHPPVALRLLSLTKNSPFTEYSRQQMSRGSGYQKFIGEVIHELWSHSEGHLRRRLVEQGGRCSLWDETRIVSLKL